MRIYTVVLAFLTSISASPAPTPTTFAPATLIDRQASTTTITTLHGTCHTFSPTNNIPRGVCTITSPTDSPFLSIGLGCNNGIIDALRLFNCSSDGSPCSARPPGILGGPVTC